MFFHCFFSFATTENILFAKTEKIYESKHKQVNNNTEQPVLLSILLKTP